MTPVQDWLAKSHEQPEMALHTNDWPLLAGLSQFAPGVGVPVQVPDDSSQEQPEMKLHAPDEP